MSKCKKTKTSISEYIQLLETELEFNRGIKAQMISEYGKGKAAGYEKAMIFAIGLLKGEDEGL